MSVSMKCCGMVLPLWSSLWHLMGTLLSPHWSILMAVGDYLPLGLQWAEQKLVTTLQPDQIQSVTIPNSTSMRDLQRWQKWWGDAWSWLRLSVVRDEAPAVLQLRVSVSDLVRMIGLLNQQQDLEEEARELQSWWRLTPRIDRWVWHLYIYKKTSWYILFLDLRVG